MADVTACEAISPNSGNGAGEDALLDFQISLDIEIEPEDAQDGRAHAQAGTQPQIQQNADSTAVPIQATTVYKC